MSWGRKQVLSLSKFRVIFVNFVFSGRGCVIFSAAVQANDKRRLGVPGRRMVSFQKGLGVSLSRQAFD
jgi:hypothetical protein